MINNLKPINDIVTPYHIINKFYKGNVINDNGHIDFRREQISSIFYNRVKNALRDSINESVIANLGLLQKIDQQWVSSYTEYIIENIEIKYNVFINIEQYLDYGLFKTNHEALYDIILSIGTEINETIPTLFSINISKSSYKIFEEFRHNMCNAFLFNIIMHMEKIINDMHNIYYVSAYTDYIE